MYTHNTHVRTHANVRMHTYTHTHTGTHTDTQTQIQTHTHTINIHQCNTQEFILLIFTQLHNNNGEHDICTMVFPLLMISNILSNFSHMYYLFSNWYTSELSCFVDRLKSSPLIGDPTGDITIVDGPITNTGSKVINTAMSHINTLQARSQGGSLGAEEPLFLNRRSISMLKRSTIFIKKP